MAQAIGAKARIIYQEETTFKTDPTTADAKLLYFISEDFKSTRNLIDSEVIRGTRDAAKPALGNIAIEGTIRTELQAYIGSLFKGLLGNVITIGTGPYVHVLKVGGSLPSFVIEKGFTDIGQYFKYNGCKINRFTLAVKAEGFQEISFDFLGAKETVSSSSFDSTPTDLGKVSWTGFDIAVIEEGGSAIGVVTEVNITVENNLDGSVYVIGGKGERYSLPEGLIKVSGTIKALFDSMSLLNKAMNSTETSLRILYKLGTGDGSAGNESLEILIPELLYSPNAPVISGPAGIFVELPFTAYYDNSTEGTSIQLTLKNTQATL